MTKSLMQKLQDELEEIVDKYVELGIQQGHALGALEMVKLNFYRAGVEEEEE